MVEEELIALYKKTKKQLALLMEDMTYTNFFRALQSGKRAFTLKNTQIKKTIDEEWINAIKASIPSLDAIVNNPRKFMQRQTEVVPIEKAKRVDSESVKHLASHSELIRSVRGSQVTPNKILTAYNDESLTLYENRFVMTLITRVAQFIDRRYFLLGTGGNEYSSSVQVKGNFSQAGEDTDYSVQMAVHQSADFFCGENSSQIYEDLFIIRKYVNAFRYSPFMKAMAGAAPVQPPVCNTNLLTKEPNYRACVKLWDFIESYDKIGYKIEVTDFSPKPHRDFAEDFDAIDLLLYVALKKKMGEFDGRKRSMLKCIERVLLPTFEEFETSKLDLNAFAVPLGLKSALNDKGKRDRDNAIKEVLLRALRKESVRRKIEEAEKREKEKQLAELVKTALSKQRQQEIDERRTRDKRMTDAIRVALKEQRQRERAESNERAKTLKRVENTLMRELRRVQEDGCAPKLRKKCKTRVDEDLLRTIIQNAMRNADKRMHICRSPFALAGLEHMPVVLCSNRLPATLKLTGQLHDYENWLNALLQESRAQIQLRNRQAATAVLSQQPQAEPIEPIIAQQDILPAVFTCPPTKASSESIPQSVCADDECNNPCLTALTNAKPSLCDGDATAALDPYAKNEQPKRLRKKDTGTVVKGTKPENNERAAKSFWRRLLELIFFWWRKK